MTKLSLPISLLWFRRDLRVSDHPALHAAIAGADQFLAVYIEDTDHPRPPGAASNWWRHHSLASLAKDLQDKNITLILRCGKPLEILQELVAEAGVTNIHWSRQYDAYSRHRDAEIKAHFKGQGLTVESHKGSLLVEPWTVKTGSDQPYKVFTPFWKSWRDREMGDPLPVPTTFPRDAGANIKTDKLDDWGLLPTKPDWAGEMRDHWQIGETAARQRLEHFIDTAIEGYKDDRNIPAGETTSGLSPYLHHGEISPRSIWHRVMQDYDLENKGAATFLSEIGWREFSYNLLYEYDDIHDACMRPEYNNFPWAPNDNALQRWQCGQTGYPIVDAGMRQLYAIGWMHNRVRMVVASFLIKHLLIDWRDGERWFWDTLVDADPASNAASWQWVAGCGMDAAPFFRIFNPITQGKRFDPDGEYTKQWVPELAKLPAQYLFAPWEAPEKVLQDACIELGKDYPHPIVEHSAARDRAMEAYHAVKGSS